MKRAIFNSYRVFNNLSQKSLLQSSIRSLSLKQNEKKGSEVVELIYQGPLTKQVTRLRLSTLSIGAGGVIAQPFLISKLLETQKIMLYFMVAGAGLLFFVPVFSYLFTRGYVYEILYDDTRSTYIAKLNNFFLRPKYVSTFFFLYAKYLNEISFFFFFRFHLKLKILKMQILNLHSLPFM